MLRIRSTDACTGTTQPWRIITPVRGWGMERWESVTAGKRRHGADWRTQSPIQFFVISFDAFCIVLYL